MTKSQKADQGVAESELSCEEKYKNIVENSTDAIFVLDQNYRFSSVNPSLAKDFGRTVEEIIGKTLDELFPDGTSDQLESNVKKVFETGKGLFFDERVMVLGQEQYVSTKLNPVRDEDGSVVAVTGIVRDMTEMRRSDAELKEKNEELEKVNMLMSGREMKMIELKEEIRKLRAELDGK